MRAGLKRVVERSLFRVGVRRLARLFRPSNTLVLAYHNVVDGEITTGEAPLHLAWNDFLSQMELLVESCEVIPLSDVLGVPPGPPGKPRVAITFDDAYRGAVRLALPELKCRGLPATVFVAPGLLGNRTFWWDALLSNRASAGPLRRTALAEYYGRADAIRAWADRERLPWYEVEESCRSASRDELWSETGNGITVASHGWSHADLARLTVAECQQELERSMVWLRREFPSFIPWLSYPYGSCSTTVRDVARSCGYEGAYRISGGWLTEAEDNRFFLPRLNVPAGLSLEGFGLRLAGLAGR